MHFTTIHILSIWLRYPSCLWVFLPEGSSRIPWISLMGFVVVLFCWSLAFRVFLFVAFFKNPSPSASLLGLSSQPLLPQSICFLYSFLTTDPIAFFPLLSSVNFLLVSICYVWSSLFIHRISTQFGWKTHQRPCSFNSPSMGRDTFHELEQASQSTIQPGMRHPQLLWVTSLANHWNLGSSVSPPSL